MFTDLETDIDLIESKKTKTIPSMWNRIKNITHQNPIFSDCASTFLPANP